MSERSARGKSFAVIFLAVVIVLGGWIAWRQHAARRSPTPASRTQGTTAAPSAAGGGGWEIDLFFSSPEGTALVPERREIPDPGDNLGRCRAILDELKRGPRGQLTPLLPVDLEIRSLFQVDNVLVIDLEPKIRETAAGALQEALLWYSMVNSLIMNSKEIKAVHFLVDGQETESILGHLDTKGAFTERLELVRWK